MSCGLLLWVPWLCLIYLLFGTSDGSPAITGYGYPVMDKSNQLLGALGNEVFIPSIFDNIKWHALTTQPAGHVYEKYSKHTVFPLLDPYQQNYPSRLSAHNRQKLGNSASRSWETQKLDKRVTSPLSLKTKIDTPSKPEQRNHLQTPKLDVINRSGTLISPRSFGNTHSTSQLANPPPAASSPGVTWIWHPKTFGGGYGMATSGYGSQYQNISSGAGVDANELNGSHLVFKELFKYHSESSDPPQTSDGVNGFSHANHRRRPSTGYHSPSKLSPRNYRKAWDVNPFWRGFPSISSLYRLLHLNFSEMEKHLQNPYFGVNKFKFTKRASQPHPPQRRSANYRLRPINIAQSSNYYQRGRYHQQNTVYLQNYR